MSEIQRLQAIEKLKRQARKAYATWDAEMARVDCGGSLAAHINPRVAKSAAEFNAAMDALARLDPECPARRLPTG